MSDSGRTREGGAASQLDAQHPWPGLPAFDEADHDFFFGRNHESDDVAERIELHRLTVLFGVSGVGKSSLLRAGVFPRLRQKHFLPVYLRLNFSRDPLDASDQIARELERACHAIRGECPSKEPDESVWEYLHRKDVRFWTDRNYLLTPVFVFDQFEEVLRWSESAERFNARSIEIIADLVEGRVPETMKQRIKRRPDLALLLASSVHNYRVVISLREDYLADLEDAKARMPSVGSNRIRLTHLAGGVATQAVFDAGRIGGIVDREVAGDIVRFVGASETRAESQQVELLAIEAALLSVVCRELNNERLDKGAATITREQLERDHGEILRMFYQRAFAGISTALRAFVEDRLVNDDGVRELVTRQTIQGTRGIDEAELDELIDRRVLRQEERDGRRLIELTHDRLAPVARAFRDDRRKEEAEERQRHEREAWVAQQIAIAELRQREAELEQRRTAARLAASRRQISIVGTLLVLVLIGAAVAIWQTYRASRLQRTIADLQREKAELDMEVADGRVVLGDLGIRRQDAVKLLAEKQRELTETQHKIDELSRPALELDSEIDPPRKISLEVKNSGTGVAHVKQLNMFVDGRHIQPDKVPAMGLPILNALGLGHEYYLYWPGEGTSVAAGASIVVLRPDPPLNRITELTFARALGRLSIELCYCSVLEKCQWATYGKPVPKPNVCE